MRLLLLIVALSGPLSGLDPARQLSQYVTRTWGTQDGFPRGCIYSIEQTRDGYLWIGTEQGLIRFDGYNFKRMNAGHPLSHVLGLLADDDNGLWLRMRRPMTSMELYRDGRFIEGFNVLGRAPASAAAMTRTAEGHPLLWVLEGEGHALLIRNGKAQQIAAPANLTRSPILALAQTRNGDIWLGTRDAGLLRVRANQATSIPGLPDPKVNALFRTSNDQVWIGTDSGLARWNGRELEPGPRELSGVQVLSLASDHNGNLWVGTNSNGLVRIHPSGRVDFLDRNDAAQDSITALLEDREGNLWVGTAQGLRQMRDSVFASFSTPEGLPAESAGPIHVDASGNVWFAPATGGLWRLEDGRPVRVAVPGLGDDVIYSIAGGRDGLWLGRRRGGLSKLTGNQLTTIGTPQVIYSVLEARDGTVWAGTLTAGLMRIRGGRVESIQSPQGLASNTVNAIHEDSAGAMWFATPAGLSRLENGNWRTFRQQDGLPSNVINTLFEDARHRVWAGTSKGVARLESERFVARPQFTDEVLGIAEDRKESLWVATATRLVRLGDNLREFTQADGLRGTAGVKRHRTVVVDGARRIWFALDPGLAVVDPEGLGDSSSQAIVHVQNVSADGTAFAPGPRVTLPAGSKRVVFEYAGLGLRVPDRIRYRYRLDPFDPDWSMASSSREAAYTNLAPGDYRFRVVSSNPDGVWNSVESTVAVHIEPLFWQTWWFRLLGVMAFVLAIVAYYRLRLLRMTQLLNVRFEERLAERTRIAQELHDTLLQGCQSSAMLLHAATQKLPDDANARPALNRVLQLLDQVIREGRDAVLGLRTPRAHSGDLATVLSAVRDELGLGRDCDFAVKAIGEPRPLHPLLRDEVYRVGREAITNAIRHSRATRIEVTLDYASDRFIMRIDDNGCGIDAETLVLGKAGHWGLAGMRERAASIGAQLLIRSSLDKGTSIELIVPASSRLFA